MIRAVVIDDVEKFRKNLIQDLHDYCTHIEVVGLELPIIKVPFFFTSQSCLELFYG